MTPPDMNLLERARLYRRLMEETGWTQAQVAEHLCVSLSQVSKALAVLDGLPGEPEGGEEAPETIG